MAVRKGLTLVRDGKLSGEAKELTHEEWERLTPEEQYGTAEPISVKEFEEMLHNPALRTWETPEFLEWRRGALRELRKPLAIEDRMD